MRIALLSVLLLNTVCGDLNVHGCNGGWFEFQCKYQRTGTYIEVSAPGGPISGRGITGDVWKPVDGHRSLYHNTTWKYWRVLVKQLDQKDFGEYECHRGDEKEIELTHGDIRVCPERSEMAYTGASITINCTHLGVNFICKESPKTCDMLNGTNPVYHISNVSPQHQGVYWCGYQPRKKDYKVSKEKIHLQVVEVTKQRIEPGQNLTHWCKNTTASRKNLVFKGEDRTRSHEIVSTVNKSNGSFTLKELVRNHTLILIIQHVKIEDSGSYWFGRERIEGKKKEIVFFHKLELTVAQLTTPPSPSHPDVTQSSTHKKNTADPDYNTFPTPSPRPQDVFWIILMIAAVVCVVLLLLALIAFIIHRRARSFAKTTKPNKEEHFYEEIQERPPQPGSGTAPKTIYAIATFPVVSSKPDVTHNKSKIFKDNVLYSVAK